MRPHMAEMLLDMKYRGAGDRFRSRHPFSEDIESVHAILFNPHYSKRRKIRACACWSLAQEMEPFLRKMMTVAEHVCYAFAPHHLQEMQSVRL